MVVESMAVVKRDLSLRQKRLFVVFASLSRLMALISVSITFFVSWMHSKDLFWVGAMYMHFQNFTSPQNRRLSAVALPH